MKISIITATYNSAATLEDTINCIKAQTYPNIEYLIIDGQSKDNTLSIIKNHEDRVDQWISEPDKGIYDAMNKGLRMAGGDVLGILNSDDFYAHNQVLEKVVNAFVENDVDTVYGDLQYVHENQTDKVVRHWKSGNYKRKKFLFGWMPPHPTFFVKRSLYEQHGLFDTSFRSAADYELMLRFLFKYEASTHYVPEVLVKMRTGGQSNASLKNRLKANQEDRRAWRRNELQPAFFTTWIKPLRKLGQYRLIG